MSLQRGSVLGVLVLCLVLVGTVHVQAQGNNGIPSQVAAMQVQLNQALATIAQLQTALNNEISARQAADTALQNAIDALAGGGVTQAVLDAAIAAEAGARASADTALQGQITALAPLMSLAPLATYVSVDTGTINDLAGPHVIFSGANVHIRSGHVSGDSLAPNGRGNLILGFNESGGFSPAERGGSHNVVVGPYHRYNFGVGLVAGYANRLGGAGATVGGGFFNNAGGEFSSVSAGSNNQATGLFASVGGGDNNIASGGNAVVGAGQLNQATGVLSSVSGGFNNAATAVLSTIGGGANQTNATGFTFVP